MLFKISQVISLHPIYEVLLFSLPRFGCGRLMLHNDTCWNRDDGLGFKWCAHYSSSFPSPPILPCLRRSAEQMRVPGRHILPYPQSNYGAVRSVKLWVLAIPHFLSPRLEITAGPKCFLLVPYSLVGGLPLKPVVSPQCSRAFRVYYIMANYLELPIFTTDLCSINQLLNLPHGTLRTPAPAFTGLPPKQNPVTLPLELLGSLRRGGEKNPLHLGKSICWDPQQPNKDQTLFQRRSV